MTDLRIHLSELGADLLIEDGELVADEGLETAIITTLFTDARADHDEILPEETAGIDPPYVREVRGFWADTSEDRWGSKLWLLSRAKATPATAAQAVLYAEEALGWLLTAGIASSVSVAAEFLESTTDGGRREKVLSLQISLERGTASRYSSLWESLEGATFEASGVRVRLLAG